MVKKKKMPEASSPLDVLDQTHHALNRPMAAKTAEASPEKHIVAKCVKKTETGRCADCRRLIVYVCRSLLL